MRWLTHTGLATLTVAALLGAQAAAARADDGGDTRVLAAAAQASEGSAQRDDKLKQALEACRARGFADGSNEQRRCAQQLLAGGAAPAPTTTAPAPTTTARAPQPATGGQLTDRQQQALAACRARGFADGSSELRRCAEQLLAGGAAPSPPPATVTGRAPQPATGGQLTDRQQQALAACRARGFADGSSEQRRCAEQLLAGGAAPRPTTTSRSPVVRGPVVTDRGIVQSAVADALVLRALDGSSLTVALDANTRVSVGDRGAGISDIQPGSVATVRHVSGGPALDVRVALPPKPKLRTDRGVTDSVANGGIVLRLSNGSTRTIALASSTRVQGPNGREISLSDLRAGLLIDVLYDPSGTVPAQTVKIIRRVS